MLSNNMKKKFCKDMNISIQMFDEPYFTDRLKLTGEINFDLYKEFEKLIETRYNNNEELFFEDYNLTKEKIIQYIKNSEAFKELNDDDMDKYKVNYNIKQSNVYKEPNVGKYFISIDMKKANFSSLVHYGIRYDKEFHDSYCWETFMKKFTDVWYFMDSKYIRQVVFGNCNPRRQVTYEKYLMSTLIDEMIAKEVIKESDIYSLCSDEIIIDTTNLCMYDIERVEKFLQSKETYYKEFVPLSFEYFMLGRIKGTSGFIKKQYNTKLEEIGYDIKCLDAEYIPCVYRAVKGEQPNELDKYFYHNNRIAKFMDDVDIEIVYE